MTESTGQPDSTGPPDPDDPQSMRRAGRDSFFRLMAFFGVVFALAIGYQLWHITSTHQRAVGDGQNVASYQFDLTPLRVDRDLLVASGRPKDHMPALASIRLIDASSMSALKQPGPRAVTTGVIDRRRERTFKGFSRLIIESDTVIGVRIGGETRAYPTRYLKAHEIVNDTLGGVPIAVTYSSISDAAVVFDRRVAGETLTFGFSGLLYNSNLVMYDKRPEKSETAESLWSQLGFRAIAGPAAEAERTLTVMPMWHGPWSRWRKAHPETTLFIGAKRFDDRYEQDHLLRNYFEKGELKFPVEPLPPKDGPLNKMDRVEAVRTDAGWRATPSDQFDQPPTQLDAPRAHACWFAWHAIHGGDTLQ